MIAAHGSGRRAALRPPMLLWVSFLVPFLAWFGQLNLNFMVAAYACGHGRGWLLHLFFAAALAAAAVGILCGLRGWRSYRNLPEEERRGAGFLFVLALAMGGFFILGIIANHAPLLLAEPCL